jgi:hypothetical protein
MAERVECGIALLTLAGWNEASRYLRNCGVPSDVVSRVLTTAIARRPHGMHLSDRRIGEVPMKAS